MRIRLPVYDETSDLERVDAFLRRNGAFVPLQLAFDPREASAADAPAASFQAEAAALLGVKATLDVERIAAVHRLIAPVAEVAARVAPIAEAVARAAPLAGGRLVGPEREQTLRDIAPVAFDRLARELDAALERDRAGFDQSREKKSWPPSSD